MSDLTLLFSSRTYLSYQLSSSSKAQHYIPLASTFIPHPTRKGPLEPVTVTRSLRHQIARRISPQIFPPRDHTNPVLYPKKEENSRPAG
ncbi:hypothetical protein BDW42DRAFT_179640, partial [Aspergillus taichungensis]